MRKGPVVLILLLAACLLTVSASAAALYSMAEVTKNAVNIRSTPGGKVAGKLTKGECVSIIETGMSGGKEWDRIIVSRKTDNVVICGYVDASFLLDVTDKYTRIAEAAPGDRHMVLRYEDGRSVAVGETFMGNLSIFHWPRTRQVAVSRFMSAGVGLDNVLYTSTGDSKPDFLGNWRNVDAIFPCAEDIDLMAIRLMDGRYFCSLEDYNWLFPDRYSGAEQVVFTPHFSAALKDGTVMVTTGDEQMGTVLSGAEGLSGIRQIACGEASLACLDASGNVRMFAVEPSLQAASGWQNVTMIAAAGGFIVGVFADGSVKMCGEMAIRNRNYAIASDEPRENFNDILSQWGNVTSIRANHRMILAIAGDGHLYLLYPNRYERY